MKMKTTLGVSAIALVIVIGLAGCTHEISAVKNTPVEQRASIYLFYEGSSNEARIEKLDGKGIGMSGFNREGQNYSHKFWGNYIRGTNVENTQNNVIVRSMQVTPGEHTITISHPAIIGRKRIDGIFDFEAGKRYIMQLENPSFYEMRKAGNIQDKLSYAGGALKETLTADYIVIMAETKKTPLPTYPDSNIKGADWVKSKEAPKN